MHIAVQRPEVMSIVLEDSPMKFFNRFLVALSLIGLVAVFPIRICWGDAAHIDYKSLYQAENYGFRFANNPDILAARVTPSFQEESEMNDDTRLLLKYVKVGNNGAPLQGYSRFRVFVPPGTFKVFLNVYYRNAPHALTAKLQIPPTESDPRFKSYSILGYSGFLFDLQGGHSIEDFAKEQKYFDSGGGATHVLDEARYFTSEEEAGWFYGWIFDPPSSQSSLLTFIDYYVDVKAGDYKKWFTRMETKFQEAEESGNPNLNPWDENGDPKENWYEILREQNTSPASQDVGGETGDHEYAFSVNESKNFRLLLNTSSVADPGPVQEWLYLRIESTDLNLNGNLVGFLTADGMVLLNDIADFSKVTFDGFGAVRDKFPILEYFGLATISPLEIGAFFGNEATLTYTYAYSTQEVHTYQEFFDAFFNNRIHRNSVTIKLTD